LRRVVLDRKTVLNVRVNSFSSQVKLSFVFLKRRLTLSPTSPISILFRTQVDRQRPMT